MKTQIIKYLIPAILIIAVACKQNSTQNHLANKAPEPKAVEKDTTEHSAKNKTTESTKVEGTTWVIDETKSNVNFAVTNFGKEVHGTIGGLNGTIHFIKTKPEASHFETSLKVNSINTNNKKRDADLMHDKYFEEDKFPEIKFQSKKVSSSGNNFITTGDLTIKGITHEVQIPFDFDEQGNTGTFSGHFTIKRNDFNIGGKGPIMGKDININIKAAATKK